MKKWVYDLVLGAVVLVISLICIVYAIAVSDPRATYFLARADTYLGLVFGFLTLLSLLLMARAWRSRKTEQGQQQAQPIWDKLTVITVAALFAYMFVLNYVGFIADSIVLMWLLSFLYSMKVNRRKKDVRSKKVCLQIVGCTGVFSVAATLATYYIFVNLLGTRLP